MAYEPVINLDELLAPIPGDNPCGESLLYSGLYDQIRKARRAEADLPQGEWAHEVKTADWPRVKTLAAEALTTQTKDLQVGAWLAEALIKLHSFAGLLDSLKLMRGLLTGFWDHVYPEADDGDLEARANALAFFDNQAAFTLKESPITNSMSEPNCSYFQWEESRKYDIPEDLSQLDSEALEGANALREEAKREHKVTGEQWRSAKNDSTRVYYEGIYAQLKDCLEEFAALDRTMDERFERQTPGLGYLKKALEDVTSLVEKTVREKRMLEPDKAGPEETAADETATARDAVGPRGVEGPIRSRQDALQRLEEVVEYFRKTEPHSPVSYLVERAIRWGQMPLEVWLREVIKERQVLEQLRDTLGLGSAPDAD
ncbi:MAG: type VI secretion system protein TssA [Acidobacteriia bacterium]|nr:type VI secretion system protein TssA [Terriglobia bacterium]